MGALAKQHHYTYCLQIVQEMLNDLPDHETRTAEDGIALQFLENLEQEFLEKLDRNCSLWKEYEEHLRLNIKQRQSAYRKKQREERKKQKEQKDDLRERREKAIQVLQEQGVNMDGLLVAIIG